MKSIAQVVEQLVSELPFVEDSLMEGIINLSSFARKIKPKVEEELMLDVSEGAIVMALKRLSENIKKNKQTDDIFKILKGCTVRSRLVEMTFVNSDTLLGKQQKLFNLMSSRKDVFVNISRGIHETTMVVSREIISEVEEIYDNEKLISRVERLASITVKLGDEAVKTPGVYFGILKLFAWEGINVVEVVSTYSGFTVLFRQEDVDRAFSLLMKKINI